MDAASRPENVGFITCPQLSEVLHGVGIRLSPVEIELLATGNEFLHMQASKGMTYKYCDACNRLCAAARCTVSLGY